MARDTNNSANKASHLKMGLKNQKDHTKLTNKIISVFIIIKQLILEVFECF